MTRLRRGRLIGGIAAVAVGALWMLQGAGILGGSVMSGHAQWIIIGGAVAIGGLVTIGTSVGRGPRG